MMKMTCKKYSFAFLSFLGIFSLMLPVSVLALTPEERRTEREANLQEKKAELQGKREEKILEMKEKRQEAFCSRFVMQAEKIAGNMTDRRSQFEERKGKRGDRIETHRDEREAKLVGNRSLLDEKRSAMYEKLEARAKTDEEKAAVAAFQKIVEDAVDTRRDAVDGAIALFRTGVDAAVAERKDDMESAVAAFKTSTEAAFSQAKADCADTTNGETVRTDFKKSLEAARLTLHSDRKASEKVGQEVKALAEARRITVKAALDEFKKTVEAARISLKAVFGESASTEDPVTP